MIYSIPAIVRFDVTKPKLAAGTLVRISARVIENRSGLCYPALLETDPEFLFSLPGEAVLPMSDFLQRKPCHNFYAIILRRSLFQETDKVFIKNPHAGLYGPKPFRFESLGEVIHYMDRNKLGFDLHRLVYISDFNVRNKRVS